MFGFLISLTGNQNNVHVFFVNVFHLPFHPELYSTNVTYKTSSMCLVMCKRRLKHCYVKCVENDSRKKRKSQNTCQKSTSIFWFPVKDIKIPDIFYKIQHFLTTSWASVIAHKDLLDLIIWMQAAPLKGVQKSSNQIFLGGVFANHPTVHSGGLIQNRYVAEAVDVSDRLQVAVDTRHMTGGV